MLEKPPAATTRQIALLADEAERRGRTLFQTWHSRFAAGVDAAREFLRTRELVSGKIIWKEDVHHWHPGQRWIWEPGGFGVFDPGINALSLLTEILPMDVCVEAALLEFPENQQSPIAANVRMRTEDGVEIGADFDFRQKRARRAAWQCRGLESRTRRPRLGQRRRRCIHRAEST
jgi:predicted dehydrogenase